MLRARAISNRYRYLVDSFCDLAKDKGIHTSVHPQQWISVQYPGADNRALTIIPAVGIPNAKRIHDIFNSIEKINDTCEDIYIIYDNRGILNSWLEHIDWLQVHLPIKAIKMTNSSALLDEFGL